MKYNKLIALACGALILAGCASDNKSTSVFFRHKAQEIPLSNEFTEKIIDNIYQRMSMDERAAQLQSMYRNFSTKTISLIQSDAMNLFLTE